MTTKYEINDSKTGSTIIPSNMTTTSRRAYRIDRSSDTSTEPRAATVGAVVVMADSPSDALAQAGIMTGDIGPVIVRDLGISGCLSITGMGDVHGEIVRRWSAGDRIVI